MTLLVHQFRCLSDNYGFLIRDEASGKVAAIDTPDADAYAAELEHRGWGLDLILNTHWHPDHAGGNEALRARYDCEIAGPAEVRKLTEIDRELADGDTVAIGDTVFRVIETGGHTLGHISLHDAADDILFVGDTLFTLGCGRMFEGTPPQYAATLERLKALPDTTTIYCAHEYTAGNLAFALSVDPGQALAARAGSLRLKIEAGEATVPTNLGEERATNPFLRLHDLPLTNGVADDAEAFRIVREAKDAFKG